MWRVQFAVCSDPDPVWDTYPKQFETEAAAYAFLAMRAFKEPNLRRRVIKMWEE